MCAIHHYGVIEVVEELMNLTAKFKARLFCMDINLDSLLIHVQLQDE
jgi:hypothetical protein